MAKAQMVRQYTYAYAALSAHDGVLDSLILPYVNAATMSPFLAEVARRHPEDFIVILIARAAEKAAAERLLTLNVEHFRRVWPEGAELIMAP